MTWDLSLQACCATDLRAALFLGCGMLWLLVLLSRLLASCTLFSVAIACGFAQVSARLHRSKQG